MPAYFRVKVDCYLYMYQIHSTFAANWRIIFTNDDKLECIDNQYDYVHTQSFASVINSDTYQHLQDDNTSFYYQTPRYVYAFLQNELITVKIKY
jgi:hypothetical protein